MRYILLTYLIISSFSLESYCQEMVQIPHQRTIAWKSKSDLANQVYQSFASKKINFDKLSERGNTPRILLAKLLLKQDIKNVNKAIQQMRVRGVTGSHWALNPKGDYDFTLMPLTTILFLFDNQPDLLYPKTKDHLINTLLTEEGGKYRRATPRTFGLVADTENHILMTEGSRYLKNRWKMLHGNLWDAQFVVESDPALEPFTERFENLLAGWTMTFDVVVPNDMTICDTGTYAPFCAPSFVVNTNASYSQTIQSGATLTLPDTTFNVQIDGSLVDTETYPTLSNQTINIAWQ
jgi:hypothetical protein